MKKNQIAKLALMGLAAFIATGTMEAGAAVSETQGVFLAGGCGKNCGSQSARSRRYNVAMEDQTTVPANPSNANQNTWNYGQQPQEPTNKAPSQVNPQPSPDQGNQKWSYRNPTADAAIPTTNPNGNNQNLMYGNTPSTTNPSTTKTIPSTVNPKTPNGEQGYWIEEDVIDVQPNTSSSPKYYNSNSNSTNSNSTNSTNNGTKKPATSYNYGK